MEDGKGRKCSLSFECRKLHIPLKGRRPGQKKNAKRFSLLQRRLEGTSKLREMKYSLFLIITFSLRMTSSVTLVSSFYSSWPKHSSWWYFKWGMYFFSLSLRLGDSVFNRVVIQTELYWLHQNFVLLATCQNWRRKHQEEKSSVVFLSTCMHRESFSGVSRVEI